MQSECEKKKSQSHFFQNYQGFIAKANDQAGHCYAKLLVAFAFVDHALRRDSFERPSPKSAGEAGRTGQTRRKGADSIGDASSSSGR